MLSEFKNLIPETDNDKVIVSESDFGYMIMVDYSEKREDKYGKIQTTGKSVITLNFHNENYIIDYKHERQTFHRQTKKKEQALRMFKKGLKKVKINS